MLLAGRLEQAVVRRINPQLPPNLSGAALKDVQRIHSPELLLTEGVPVSMHKDGEERGERVWLIDFANPENNEFLAVTPFTVHENQKHKRPDMALFVNGIPLVVVELKNAADDKAKCARHLQTGFERLLFTVVESSPECAVISALSFFLYQ